MVGTPVKVPINVVATVDGGALFVNTLSGKVFIEKNYEEANTLTRELRSSGNIHSVTIIKDYPRARQAVLRWLYNHDFIENYEVEP